MSEFRLSLGAVRVREQFTGSVAAGGGEQVTVSRLQKGMVSPADKVSLVRTETSQSDLTSVQMTSSPRCPTCLCGSCDHGDINAAFATADLLALITVRLCYLISQAYTGVITVHIHTLTGSQPIISEKGRGLLFSTGVFVLIGRRSADCCPPL